MAMVKFPITLHKAVYGAKRILKELKAEVVAGFGGYVSTPVYIAARMLSLPIVVHEGNSTPGLANKVGARWAKRVFTTYPATPLPKAEHVGLPVRPAIANLSLTANRASAREAFELPDTPVLLVSGGSQGARSINNAVISAKERVLEQGVSILHVLGPKNFEQSMKTVQIGQACYQPVAFVDGMENAYPAADLMLARAGSATVFETAMIGLPAVFVPLPIGNGEQSRNCEFLVSAGAAIRIPDAELDADKVVGQIASLALDGSRLASMGEKAKTLVSADAAQKVAQGIAEAAHAAR
jgi:UDP-N-acetylglucosamine--N-acetylmuramyl-(pentapeptide) pyrophosphoryl-undecaprenol N-acetylglucosamine transferase